MVVPRRHLLLGGACALTTFALVSGSAAQPFVDASAFGLSDSLGDQTTALQAAINAATSLRQPLFIGAGTYEINGAILTGPLTIRGSGQTMFLLRQGNAVFSIKQGSNVVLEGLTFSGGTQTSSATALVEVEDASPFTIRDCRFLNAAGNGINTRNARGHIRNCEFADIGETAIFSLDSQGLDVEGNAITRCGNGGIRIWRSETGPDGSQVFANRISEIGWVGGGNGQHGNGINVFRADGVSVSDNHITDCAFSAIRLNATNDTRIIGNHCENSGEVTIFSEFGFSGSIISNNLIEGGAAGISMTNFDHGGRLSVCNGNIVRNIAPRSLTNPDTVPYGIAAEADAAVVGNVIEAVPGTGIVVGWGPYLRDVLVNDNLVRDCDIGIAVSVAEGAGSARISGNLVSGSLQHAIVGAQWDKIVATDLADKAAEFDTLTVEGNTVL